MDDEVSRIAGCLATALDRPDLRTRVGPRTSLLRDLGIDSLQMITFLLRVEDEFDVAIDYESLELAHLETVESFRAFALGRPTS